MDADDQELALLEKDIADSRQHYVRSRDHLRLAAIELGGQPDTVDRLLTLAEEKGSDEVADRLADSGRELGFDRPNRAGQGEGRQKLLDLVNVAAAAHADLCNLTAARETILRRRDPTRPQHICLDGRDVIFDIRNGQVRFADGDTSLPLRIDVVEPSGLPEKSLEALRAARQRERNR